AKTEPELPKRGANKNGWVASCPQQPDHRAGAWLTGISGSRLLGRRARLSQDRCGLKEVFEGEVCQAPTGNRLRCNNHPDLVDTLLPRQRHVAVDPDQQFVKVLEFDLFTGATNEDAPSRTAGFIDVVDLEGNIVFPQCTYFGPILRTEDDAMTSEGIVDWNGCRSEVVHVDEPSNGLL